MLSLWTSISTSTSTSTWASSYLTIAFGMHYVSFHDRHIVFSVPCTRYMFCLPFLNSVYNPLCYVYNMEYNKQGEKIQPPLWFMENAICMHQKTNGSRTGWWQWKHSPFDAVKSMATVKWIWVLKQMNGGKDGVNKKEEGELSAAVWWGSPWFHRAALPLICDKINPI